MPDQVRHAGSVTAWLQPNVKRSRRGHEAVGPCPLCGGTDRFHVREGPNGKALVGCRGCIDGRDPETKARRFWELLRTVFPNWAGFAPTRQKTGHAIGQKRPISPRPSGSSATSCDPATPAKRALAARLLEATGPAYNTPARIYLARRWVWPPVGIGPDLPASVRWLPCEPAPPKDETTDWYGIPRLPSAVGAICFAFHSLTTDELTGVGLEALDSNGQRTPYTYKGQHRERWRKNAGLKAGAVFTVGEGGAPLVLCEGEVTALACKWLYPGSTVWATGGAAGLAAFIPVGEQPIIIAADGDASGRTAALTAAHRLREAGRAVQIIWSRSGQDAAKPPAPLKKLASGSSPRTGDLAGGPDGRPDPALVLSGRSGGAVRSWRAGKIYPGAALAIAATPTAPGLPRMSDEDNVGRACGLCVRAGPVVLVSYEDAPVRIVERVKRMAAEGVRDILNKLHVLPNPAPLFEAGSNAAQCGDSGGHYGSRCITPTLVVIDPASAALGGLSE